MGDPEDVTITDVNFEFPTRDPRVVRGDNWEAAGMFDELKAESLADYNGSFDAAHGRPPDPTPAYEAEYQAGYDQYFDDQAGVSADEIAGAFSPIPPVGE